MKQPSGKMERGTRKEMDGGARATRRKTWVRKIEGNGGR